MKRSRLPILWAFAMTLFLLHVCLVFAEAPATAKIVFSSGRDGNWESYLMNPDGHKKVSAFSFDTSRRIG